MMAQELFNKIYYTKLLPEDRCIIDEYVDKMSIPDINSFMRRLIQNYREIEVETKEDEAVVVFERNMALSQKVLEKQNVIKVSYKKLIKYFDKVYDENLNRAIKLYFDAHLVGKYVEIGYDANEQLTELYCENAIDEQYVKTLDTIALLSSYVYRNNSKRPGIVIDAQILNNKNGFSKNSKMRSIDIQTNDNNLSQYIKSAVYWTDKNAKRHGFSKAGIIWIDGKQTNDGWKIGELNFKDSIEVNVKLKYTTDAFIKMLQRFNFIQQIKNAGEINE